VSDETPRLVWAHNGYLTSEAHRAAKRRLAVGAAWPIEALAGEIEARASQWRAP